MEKTVPVYILSGFLGSGKTTLLSRTLKEMKERGRRPAVVMNELGEVNLDGVAVGVEVPMAEMLDGCICCTVRGDLGLTIQQLVQDEKPDAIFIEATGVANPMEILDGVSEASLYMKIEIRGVVTVVDAAMLKAQMAKGTGKTYRLLEEQVRCASLLVLNKTDLAESEEELSALEAALREWNPYARMLRAVRAEIDPDLVLEMGGQSHDRTHGPTHDHSRDHTHEPTHKDNHDHTHEHGEGCSCQTEGERKHHHSHEHVMVYTHYLNGPVDSRAFEEMVGRLPESVYRAKGVLTFRDTANRYLFQYAYRQADFMNIRPQGGIPDVVVFIGEQIPREELADEMRRLEAAGEEPELSGTEVGRTQR